MATAAAPRTTEVPSPSELIAEGRIDEGLAAYRAAKPDLQTLNRTRLRELGAR